MLYFFLQSGLRRWLRSDRAATAIEYGLIAGVISLAIVGAVLLMGDSLQSYFSSIAERMADAESQVN